MRALRSIDQWPVSTAAAAVVTADGEVIAMHGSADHRFALASVTKPLTAYAVLVAISEGALGLDDPIDVAGLEGATVRHLLAHASGMRPDDRVRAAAPGTRRIYSNAGYELLAELVEQATGIGFADYLRQGVLEPLRMTSTTLDGSAAAAGTSSIDDLAKFVAELQNPRLLAATTVAEATGVAFPGLAGVVPGYGRQDPNDWGLGVEIRDHKAPHWTGSRNSPSTYGHFGRSGTFFWVDPELAAGCVCLTDCEFEQWAIDAWPVLNDAIVDALSGRGQ